MALLPPLPSQRPPMVAKLRGGTKQPPAARDRRAAPRPASARNAGIRGLPVQSLQLRRTVRGPSIVPHRAALPSRRSVRATAGEAATAAGQRSYTAEGAVRAAPGQPSIGSGQCRWKMTVPPSSWPAPCQTLRDVKVKVHRLSPNVTTTPGQSHRRGFTAVCATTAVAQLSWSS